MTFTGVVTATFNTAKFLAVTALAYYGTSVRFNGAWAAGYRNARVDNPTVTVVPTAQIVKYSPYTLGYGLAAQVPNTLRTDAVKAIKPEPKVTAFGPGSAYVYQSVKFTAPKFDKVPSGVNPLFVITPNSYLGTSDAYFGSFAGFTNMTLKSQPTVEPYYGSRLSSPTNFSFWS